MCLDNLKSLSQTTIIIQKRGVYMYTRICIHDTSDMWLEKQTTR
jgi:hypothetical protein